MIATKRLCELITLHHCMTAERRPGCIAALQPTHFLPHLIGVIRGCNAQYFRPGFHTGVSAQWASYLHPSKFIARKYWQAFADGISITYIFLRLLPEISHLASQQTLSDKQYTLQFSGPFASLSAWGEHSPFLPLLIGFTLFYGLEKWMQKASAQVSREEAQIHFWVHMLGLAIYKILLGYLLAHMRGWAAIVAFTLAMVMHFLVIDFHLVDMHRRAYQKIGRWILTVSFLIGWVISLFAIIASPVLAMLVSFVAGGAVLLIIQDEFSKEHESSFIAFLSAVVLYGAVLLSV